VALTHFVLLHYFYDIIPFYVPPLLGSIGRLLYPPSCEVCRATLELEENILCRRCSGDLDALAGPMESAQVDEHFEYLDHVWTVYAYETPGRELLHGVKYSRKDYLLKSFRQRAAGLAQTVTSDTWYDAVLPIPVDRLKRVQRHFNQAEILAAVLRTSLRPPVQKNFLAKRRPIPSQTSLNRDERAINVYGAFSLRRPAKASGRSFLLLDDVLTTGATANEAARLLKQNGARRVDFFALARTLTPVEKKIPGAMSQTLQE
jgi:ComF family protein